MKRIREKFNLLATNKPGFTLIELLIVIVIIGILAGVLIAVIDPTAQQNRARDANLRAAINKVALATAGYVSSYGRIPNDIEFVSGISVSATVTPTPCTGNGVTAATDAECLFELNSLVLTSTCTAAGGNYSGHLATGGVQCYLRYCGGAMTSATDGSNACVAPDPAGPGQTAVFRLEGKAYGSANTFIYNSANSAMYICQADLTGCTSQ